MSRAEGLYEAVLAAAGGSAPAVRPPRPSAAVVLHREGPAGLEVFWLRRAAALPFMGGWRAFPGGGLERGDAALPVSGTPAHPQPGGRTPGLPDLATLSGDPDLAPGLAAAALRELYEETGVLIAEGGELGAAARAPARPPLAELLAGRAARLDAGRLVFAGRWLTPPFAPVRFDNRFFLAAWRAADGEPEAGPPESASGEWIAPARALERVGGGGEMAAPPIVHLLRVLAEEGPERGLRRLMDTSEANLGPLRRIELRPGILLFPLATATLPPASHTNVHLVGHGEALLIDPGADDERENERLLAALDAARERLGRRAVAILLTHHHPDHVGGAAALARRLGIPVWAHAATAEHVARRGIAVARQLADGERIELAGTPPMTLLVHHTPGHARGHLALEVEGAGDLLGGDHVAGFSTIVIAPPEGDMDDYLASLERMRARGLRTLFPAHGAPLLEVDAALEAVIAHRLDRERQILTAWRAGHHAAAEILPVVYADTPPLLHPLAERQIEAHLERLKRRGELQRGD